MDTTFSEEQEMLKKSARDFLAQKCPVSLIREMETGGKLFSPELWKEMAGLGWLGLAIPRKYNGGDMTFLDFAVLLEETGRAMVPAPLVSSVVLAGMLILDIGSERQKQAYLPDISAGKSILALALTETTAGYDSASVKTKAVADGNDFVISGKKAFVSDAGLADRLIVVARTAAGKAGDGITAFIIDAKSPSVKITQRKSLASDGLCEVQLTRVRVPAENVLGQVGGAWPAIERAVQRGAVAKCCEVIGLSRRIMEMSIEHVMSKKRFGRPIGALQAVQLRLGRMLTDITGISLSAYQAAWRISEGMPCTREVAIAKAWMNQASERIIKSGHDLHGAIGLDVRHDLPFYTRRAKAAQTSFGDTDYYKEIIAGQTLDN